jgi:hypothetical protein
MTAKEFNIGDLVAYEYTDKIPENVIEPLGIVIKTRRWGGIHRGKPQFEAKVQWTNDYNGWHDTVSLIMIEKAQ